MRHKILVDLVYNSAHFSTTGTFTPIALPKHEDVKPNGKRAISILSRWRSLIVEVFARCTALLRFRFIAKQHEHSQ